MTPLSFKITVAIASDFLESFSKIPRKKQGKVMEFITKFRSNPSSSGINYEKIIHAKDPNMRSVRIDQSYRGIILKPESGNVYVLLWVDTHDKAYQWAEKKTYQIHPETGSLQVIEIEETKYGTESVSPQKEQMLFDDIRDRHLMKLGIPEIQIPLIRNIKTSKDLEKISDKLPQEAYESLFFLSEGFTLDDVLRNSEVTEKEKKVDVTDYEAALDKPDSRRRFHIVDDDLELAAILNAPLEKWRIFLHPTQQSTVERDWNGPVRILGGAGTGKTVAAIHRAKWLIQNCFTHPKDKIFFTTFTRNLAIDIQENLKKICSKDVLVRIEVMNLDRWVSHFLLKNGYDYKIDYGNQSNQLWHKVLDMIPSELNYDLAFYREEWERVIQPQGITTFEHYQKASRVGRGIRLNRKARKLVWHIFEEYRILMNEQGLREPDDAIRDARLLLEQKKEILPYKAIIVDEAQDMGPQAFMLLRQMVPEGKNDMFIVGDAHQRIYRHQVILGQCGINIMGRGNKFWVNYRTTDETRKWAIGLLKGVNVDDLNGGIDDQKGYKSLMHGLFPELKHFNSFQEETEYIGQYIEKIKKETGSINEICLVARTNSLLKQYEEVLQNKGFDTYFIHRSEPEDRQANGVRLATMHRVKGLEFSNIIISSVNDRIMPLENSEIGSSDLVVQSEHEMRERALLYVAATRAKKEVLVTSYGKISRFL